MSQLYSPFMLHLYHRLAATRELITVDNIMSTLILFKKDFDSLEWLSDVSAMILRIQESSTKLNTQWTHCKNIQSCLRDENPIVCAQWRLLSRPIAVAIADALATRKKSDSQEQGMIPWSSICAKRDSLPTSSPVHLLLCLYTLIPPLRNDFVEMDVVASVEDTADTKVNYYVLGTQEIILNVYKTAKLSGGGQKRFKVPERLAAVIAEQRPAGTPMLVGVRGKRLCRSSVATLLTNTFGIPMGPTMLRHIYLTEHYRDSIESLERDTYIMCNSPSVVAKYYIKRDASTTGEGQ